MLTAETLNALRLKMRSSTDNCDGYDQLRNAAASMALLLRRILRDEGAVIDVRVYDAIIDALRDAYVETEDIVRDDCDGDVRVKGGH